jgi:hypothetical protein
MSNDLAKRVSELEHKIKEFALERQKVQNIPPLTQIVVV